MRRAGFDAGGNPFFLDDVLVVDAIDAERAFAHHPLVLVELPRPVGAGPGTQLAADADVGVHQHDAVFRAFVGRAGGADRHAGRLFAMQAGAREMHRAAFGAGARLVGVHAVEPHPVLLRFVGMEIGQRRGVARRVPLLAVHRAGMAADAGIEVDHEAELLAARRGNTGHAAITPRRRKRGREEGRRRSAGCPARVSAPAGGRSRPGAGPSPPAHPPSRSAREDRTTPPGQ